jgi:replication-associated recombination protein RarA
VIPPTKNGLSAFGCISAMQKCIRRGLERQAMEFAVELMHTSKQFHTMVCNRLEIICHEDIDNLADPCIAPFVKAAMDQARAWYDTHKMGKSRMPVGNAIRLMARAKKSREGDHFQGAIGLASELEGFAPTIPDWAHDMHTIEGRKKGRGLDHFRRDGTLLNPPPDQPDAYEEEFYRLVAIKKLGKKQGTLEV